MPNELRAKLLTVLFPPSMMFLKSELYCQPVCSLLTEVDIPRLDVLLSEI